MTPHSVSRPFILLIGLIALTFVAAAAQNVTTVIHDYAIDASQLLMRSDDYNGSGQATYTSFSSRNASLSSSIVNGEWDLILYSQSLRTLWIRQVIR